MKHGEDWALVGIDHQNGRNIYQIELLTEAAKALSAVALMQLVDDPTFGGTVTRYEDRATITVWTD